MGLAVDLLLENAPAPIVFIELLFGMSGLKLWIDRPKMLVLSDYNIAMRSREEGFCDAWYSKKRAFDVGAGATVQNKLSARQTLLKRASIKRQMASANRQRDAVLCTSGSL